MLAGDIHPNAGPVTTTIANSNVHAVDTLRILRWNCRGIDNKLSQLLQFLKGHGIHVSNLTETRRSLARHKTQQSIHLDGYTFHFASYVDSSLSTNCLPPSACEWGVCIAIRDGIAYQKIETDSSPFQARVLHGKLNIPTTTDEIVIIEIFGVYAPANESDKHAFWMQFSTYLLACLQRIANNENRSWLEIGIAILMSNGTHIETT
jgi:exonuclease III